MSSITDGITAGIRDFQAWKQQDQCVVFPIITDLHSNLTESDPRNSQKRVTVKHLELLFLAADAAQADFAADLGDEGFEVPLKNEEECTRLLDYMNSVCSRKTVPFIHCIGNHDLFSGRLDGAFWGNWLAGITEGKSGFDIERTGGYGCFDIPGKECRVLFLNTSDDPNRAGFTEKQLAYLRERLMSLPSGHTAIVLTHICPLNSARWRNYPVQDTVFRFPELANLLTEFVRSGGKLAGVFSGDSHFDYFDSLDGVNYFVTQGCGGIGPNELPPQGRVYHQHSEQLGRCDTFDSTESCLIDLAAIKTEKREVRIFRLGAGGFYFHRGAKF
jgi:hypothetical protein